MQITSNLKNTITGMKAIIGKKFHSDLVQREIDLVGYPIVDVAGKVGCPVQYCDEEVMLTPERATAMLMKCLQKIAEMDQGAPVTDVVVSVRVRFPLRTPCARPAHALRALCAARTPQRW